MTEEWPPDDLREQIEQSKKGAEEAVDIIYQMIHVGEKALEGDYDSEEEYNNALVDVGALELEELLFR